MKFARKHPVASFFALALALSWAVWIPGTLLLSDTASTALLFVGSFGPAVAGVLLTKARGRSLRAWVRDMARFRIGTRWWLIAVGLPVGIAAVSTVVYAIRIGRIDPSTLSRRVPLWLFGLVVISLVGGGNEEPGWRGYALPVLQREYSALTASVVIGVVWAIWHLPMFVLSNSLYAGQPFSLYAPMVVLFSIVMTWFYNSTGGSVPAAMLLHAGVNSANALVPAPLSNQAGAMPGWSLNVMLACFTFLALALVLYYGPETLSKRGKRTPDVPEGDSTVDERRIDEHADA
jgi:membrane protease YdiL (CAAX protease family)